MIITVPDDEATALLTAADSDNPTNRLLYAYALQDIGNMVARGIPTNMTATEPPAPAAYADLLIPAFLLPANKLQQQLARTVLKMAQVDNLIHSDSTTQTVTIQNVDATKIPQGLRYALLNCMVGANGYNLSLGGTVIGKISKSPVPYTRPALKEDLSYDQMLRALRILIARYRASYQDVIAYNFNNPPLASMDDVDAWVLHGYNEDTRYYHGWYISKMCHPTWTNAEWTTRLQGAPSAAWAVPVTGGPPSNAPLNMEVAGLDVLKNDLVRSIGTITYACYDLEAPRTKYAFVDSAGCFFSEFQVIEQLAERIGAYCDAAVFAAANQPLNYVTNPELCDDDDTYFANHVDPNEQAAAEKSAKLKRALLWALGAIILIAIIIIASRKGDTTKIAYEDSVSPVNADDDTMDI